jgi:hypothetical protein
VILDPIDRAIEGSSLATTHGLAGRADLFAKGPGSVRVLAIEETADDGAFGLVQLDQGAELVLQLSDLHGVFSFSSPGRSRFDAFKVWGE